MLKSEAAGGISIVVVRDLPKVEAPVRSWYPAPSQRSLVVEQCFRKAEVVGSTPTAGSSGCQNLKFVLK